MQCFRPLSISAIGGVAFLAWAWLGMSNMDYRHAVDGSGLRTSGWFVLKLPMLLPIAALSTMPFSMLIRSGKPVLAWVGMLLVFTVAIWYTHTQSTPHARLAWALDVDIPRGTRINLLRQTDSFGDGSTVWGSFVATPDLVDNIIERHSLTAGRTGGSLLTLMPDASIPDDGLGYHGDRLSCYYDTDQSLLYFLRRPSEPRP